jgi:hypothetical protein
LPQPPQSLGLVLVFAQYGCGLGFTAVALGLQSVSAPPHPLHLPATHTKPDEHALPHAPQLSMSTCGSMQAFPQRIVLFGHTQLPPMHDSPWSHFTPQWPQLSGSFASVEQVPPHATPSGQLAMQTAWKQTCPEAHFAPHPPQLSGSAVGSTHMPFPQAI